MATEKKTCSHCGKQQGIANYYKTKTTEIYEDGCLPVCKSCLENNFRATDPASFMHILKAIDVPWIPSEYRAIYNKNVKPTAPNSISILGKYIMKMKLVQYKEFGFLQSKEAQEKYETKENYDPIENYNYNRPLETPSNFTSSKSNFNLEERDFTSYREDQEVLRNMDEEEKESETLYTPEEKHYLYSKWGRGYDLPQLLILEKLYLEMCEDFDIRTATQKDYLKKYCVASLRYDECLANQDYESAKKASSMFTNINKEAGFQPIQNQNANENYLNAVSYMVKLAESEGPINSRLWQDYIDYPEDIIDLSIKDIKLWQQQLVANDDSIMSRYAEAYSELQEQDKLLEEEDFGEDDKPQDDLNGIDLGYYDQLEVSDEELE